MYDSIIIQLHQNIKSLLKHMINHSKHLYYLNLKLTHGIKFMFLFSMLSWSSYSVAGNGDTLKSIKANGIVRCGVNIGLAGFAMPDKNGKWNGLDVDIGYALSAAIFGDVNKVKFIPLSAQQRFTALQSGEIDVLTRNTTWTLQRDTSSGLNFGPINYYDGQAFMINRSIGVESALQLGGATVCVTTGTTSELNLSDYFRTHNMSYNPVVIDSKDELSNALFSGRCDVFTADASALAAERTKAKNPNDYIILPEIISKEPLCPAVRHGDDQWLDLVTWTVYAMINAEELGITSKNVDKMLKNSNPKIQRLLGVIPGMGKTLGVDDKWAYNIIKLVGNYGESFERNLGKNTPLKLQRGLNQLWSKGGILYAPPIR